MNPLPKTPPTTTAGRTVVVGGSTSGVSFHTHPAHAIISGELDDDRMPERIKPIPSDISANADDQTEAGWWAAGPGTSNMPAASSWVAETVRWPANDLGVYAVQIAYETTGAFRVYQRIAEIFWNAWVQIDRAFYDTRYRLVSDISYQKDIQTAGVTPNGTANSALTGLSISVTSPGTSAVYQVRMYTDVSFTGAQVNIIELLVDGVAQTEQIVTSAGATGYRFPGSKEWLVTGLAAGTRTFTAQTRNTAAGTAATVQATHTLMYVERVS